MQEYVGYVKKTRGIESIEVGPIDDLCSEYNTEKLLHFEWTTGRDRTGIVGKPL